MHIKQVTRAHLIEVHPQRADIEQDIINGMSYRKISEKYDKDFSHVAVHRYATDRLRDLMSQGAKMGKWNGDRIVSEIERQMDFGNKLLDACGEALQDPDDPHKFTLDPSSTDIEVIYIDTSGTVPVRKRATLQDLLQRVSSSGDYIPQDYHYAKSDPRKLLLDSIGRLGSHLELLAKVKGEIQDASIAIVKSETWQSFQAIIIENLKDYPEVRETLADRLREL